MTSGSVSATAQQLLAFIDASPTPFHAVEQIRLRLEDAGFREFRESEPWDSVDERGYVIRGGGTIAAWVRGAETPASHGFRIIGAHTDSPNLHVKPNPDLHQHGYHQLGVEVYGGVLLSSWMDRDLTLAGQVHVKDAGSIRTHLVHLDKPLLRIPLLAIHLNRNVNEKGLILNAQSHLPPLLALEGEADEQALKSLLGETLGVDSEAILSYDLSLCDTQPSAILGRNGEFVAAPRLDNLCSCFCGLEALLADLDTPCPQTRMLACFDHEEIGSLTTQGARSSLLRHTLGRLVRETAPEAYERSVANSVLLSADMAHAVHPNYPDRHDPQHFPKINAGPVIKINAQGRYATSGWSEAWFELICQEREIPVQKFVNRTDLACGSTIGPFVASDLGLPTLDVGAAMLSMHSIRELCGSQDPGWLTQAFSGFLTRSLT